METLVNDNGEHLFLIVILKGWILAAKDMAGILISHWKQLIIFPVGILLGLYFSDNLKLKKIITPGFLIYCTIAFIIAYLAQTTLLTILIKRPIGYGRIFFFLEMLLFILILLYGTYFGFLLASYSVPRIMIPLVYTVSLIILLTVGYDYYRNYKYTTVFAKAYDSRIQDIRQMKKSVTSEKVYLKSLPSSRILQFMEILPDNDSTTDLPYENSVYVRYYQLPFKIYLAN